MEGSTWHNFQYFPSDGVATADNAHFRLLLLSTFLVTHNLHFFIMYAAQHGNISYPSISEPLAFF